MENRPLLVDNFRKIANFDNYIFDKTQRSKGNQRQIEQQVDNKTYWQLREVGKTDIFMSKYLNAFDLKSDNQVLIIL